MLLLGSNSEVRTIPLAVQGFIGSFVRQWNLIMVSTLLAMLPIIVLYVFARKYIVQGMVEGAVKQPADADFRLFKPRAGAPCRLRERSLLPAL